ncbi:MAG: PQQ-binding-like beta-propeller repeat protein [Planctomycetota bacterium]
MAHPSLTRNGFPLVILLVLSPLGAQCEDTDWPQWRGPNRDGHAAAQSLMQSWPEGGPKLKWEFSATGIGYSAVAVANGQLFTMGAVDEQCEAICLDSQSGAVVWRTPVSRAGTPEDYLSGWGAGPRCTPTVNGDQVFVLTDVGTLAAIKRTDGSIQWHTDLVANHGGSIPKWGYSESPLVDGDRVVVTPGGDNFMIGLDRRTGQVVWRSQGASAPAQYVSVMKGRVGSIDYYVTASSPGLLAFDAQSGQKVFEDKATGNSVAVIPTPVIAGDQLYHTSDYGSGNTLLKLQATNDTINAESVYHLDGKTMRNHHGGVVLVDQTIYGCSKIDGGVWLAQDLDSGETLWKQKVGRNKSGSIAFADGRLYCYNDKDGTLQLVQPDRNAWMVTGELTLPRQTEVSRNKGAIWAHPVIANQTLFIRDQDLIFAFDIARE